jgi:hypothetical protein
MLIQTPYTTADAITLKLNSSEEIIARYVEEDANTITVTKPMALMMGQNGPGLGPFCFTVNPDAHLKLNKSLILFITKSDPEMGRQYIQSTTGIAL